jgi:hypothetical protein
MKIILHLKLLTDITHVFMFAHCMLRSHAHLDGWGPCLSNNSCYYNNCLQITFDIARPNVGKKIVKIVQHGHFSFEKPLVWTLEIEQGRSSFEPMMSPNMSPRLSDFARGNPFVPNLTRCIPHSGHNWTIHEAMQIGFNGLLSKDLTYGI